MGEGAAVVKPLAIFSVEMCVSFFIFFQPCDHIVSFFFCEIDENEKEIAASIFTTSHFLFFTSKYNASQQKQNSRMKFMSYHPVLEN